MSPYEIDNFALCIYRVYQQNVTREKRSQVVKNETNDFKMSNSVAKSCQICLQTVVFKSFFQTVTIMVLV